MLSHSATAAPSVPSRSSGDTNVPPSRCTMGWVESRLERSAAPRSRLVTPTAVVLWTHRAIRQPPASSAVAENRIRPARPSKANVCTSGAAASSSSGRGAATSRRSTARCPPSGAACRKRTSAPMTASGPAWVTRAAAAGETPPPPLRIGRWVDDPKRRRGRVLGGAGRVRIERIALVQERAQERFEAGVHDHTSQPRTADGSSRLATAASSDGRPACAEYRRRSSVVSGCSRTQLLFG